MPDPTPGQVAYAAYWRTCAYARVPLILPWSALAPDQHRAWEAAAQAVLEHAAFPPFDPGSSPEPALDTIQGQALRLEDETHG